MKSVTAFLLLIVTIGLSACSGGFGARNSDASAASPGTADPHSTAYFNETVGDRVHFAVDESTLSDEARATLNSQATWMIENPEYAAIVEGHADEQGTREYNLALGARRASAARDYLVARGVASNRLRIVSYGKERPIAICSDEGCYAQNRRAVTVVSSDNPS